MMPKIPGCLIQKRATRAPDPKPGTKGLGARFWILGVKVVAQFWTFGMAGARSVTYEAVFLDRSKDNDSEGSPS